jgi:ferric-dicitrate binding protein FerR (iron transport regulator)
MEKSEPIKDNIKILIVNYLTSSGTEKDLDLLNDWINASTENRRYFNQIKDSWILSGGNNINSLAQTEEYWNRLKAKISNGSQRSGSDEINPGRIRILKYLKLAALWLLIFGLGSALTWLISGRGDEKTATSGNGIIEFHTPLGAKSEILMPDSTKIWLNAGTTITYNQDYGQNERVLNLNGEAFFDVKKDSIHSFIVNTQDIAIHALGTRFNVKAYPDEKTISTTLEEGKIDVRFLSIADRKESVLLKPKDKLIYHKETCEKIKYTESAEERIILPDTKNKVPDLKNIAVIPNVRTELYTSWKDPRWIIDREPLSTLVPMLERRFNLKIIFEDEQLKNFKFTGTIENETVDQLLSALKLTAPIYYTINKDTLRLSLDLKASEKFKEVMSRNN